SPSFFSQPTKVPSSIDQPSRGTVMGMATGHSSKSSSTARSTSSACGTTAFSSGGLYGVGVKAPCSRRMGASRSSKPASTTRGPGAQGRNPHSEEQPRAGLRPRAGDRAGVEGGPRPRVAPPTRAPPPRQPPAPLQRPPHHEGQRHHRHVGPLADDGRPPELDL